MSYFTEESSFAFPICHLQFYEERLVNEYSAFTTREKITMMAIFVGQTRNKIHLRTLSLTAKNIRERLFFATANRIPSINKHLCDRVTSVGAIQRNQCRTFIDPRKQMFFSLRN